MKIASHVLLFSQDKWILKNIENAAPFVDKIYIAWSDKPWTYNKNARGTFFNRTNPNMLKKSKYFDKIVLIKGVWETEEAQRNACVEAAKKDGMDFLLVHDADEFYTFSEFERMVKTIKDNPDFDYYRTPWISFWKNFENIIVKENGEKILGYPEVALNLNRGVKFQRCRRLTGSKVMNMDIVCHHASYVLDDGACWEKISTWGHSHQFNRKNWYDTKWKKWTPKTRNLHPITPKDWYKTEKFTKQLPEILK